MNSFKIGDWVKSIYYPDKIFKITKITNPNSFAKQCSTVHLEQVLLKEDYSFDSTYEWAITTRSIKCSYSYNKFRRKFTKTNAAKVLYETK